MTEFFHPKDEQTLKDQVEKAGSQIGEPLFSDQTQLDTMLKMTPEELQETYPLKYRAYIESLHGRLRPADAGDLAKTIWAINNTERFAQALEGEESEVALWAHQVEVFKDILAFLEAGERKGWIKLPTGSGKTVLFSSLIKATGLRSLVLVPRTKLIDQTNKQLKKLGIEPTNFYGKEKDVSGSVVVSTYQSLGALTKATEGDVNAFDLIICDEAHRALTKLAQTNLEKIASNPIVIGMTATPEFSEEKKVGNYFGELIHEMSLPEAIMADVLSGVRCLFVSTDMDISLIKVMQTGEYDQNELEKALDTEKRNQIALELLKAPQLQGKSTAIFCLSVNHAVKIANLMQENGLSATAIYGNMPDSEKEKIYVGYESGEIQVICAADILTEGWDAPRTEIGLMLKPTKSPVVAEQRAGRVLRKFGPELGGQKNFGVIIEVADKGESADRDIGVTMVDILGGVAVMPPSIEEKWQESGLESLGFEPLTLEGMRIITNVEEIIRLNKKEAPTEITFTDKDQVRAVLEASNLGSPAVLATMATSSIISTRFEHPFFTGSGNKLIKKYFRDLHNRELRFISTKQVIEFYTDLFEGEYANEYLNQVAQTLNTTDITNLLEELSFMDPNDYQNVELVIERRGKPRATLSYNQLITGIRANLKRGGKPAQPGQAYILLAKWWIKFGELVDDPDSFDFDEKNIQHMIEAVYKSSASDFAERWWIRKQMIEKAKNGRLSELILKTYNRTVELSSIEHFRHCNLEVGLNAYAKGWEILRYYKITTQDEFKKWVEEMMIEIFKRRSENPENSKRGSKITPPEGYSKEVKRELRAAMLAWMKDTHFSRFTQMEDFLLMRIPFGEQGTVSGENAMTILGYKLYRNSYRAMLDKVTEHPSFSLEFDISNRGLIIRILIDSVVSAYPQYKSPKGGLSKFPPFDAFANIPLKSSSLSEEPYLTIRIKNNKMYRLPKTGMGLLLAWKNMDKPENIIGSANNMDYVDFAQYLTGIKKKVGKKKRR